MGQVVPVECEIEIETRRLVVEAQPLVDRAERRRDPPLNHRVAERIASDLGLRPFEIGDLGFARLLEHAVAGVPVGLQRDVVEMSVRQAADARLVIAEGEPFDRKPAAAVEPRRQRIGRDADDSGR